MRETIVVLVIPIIGYGALILHFLRDRKKSKYISEDISGEKYITEDIGKGENNG